MIKQNGEQTMTRQSNFDALRIVAMLMIVTWHVCIHGDLQSAIGNDGAKRIILQAIFALTVIGTNLYVLLTGYFQSRSSFKISKLAKLWGAVLFYSIGFTVIYSIVFHRFPGNLALFCFPVITRAYWFVTVYVVLLYVIVEGIVMSPEYLEWFSESLYVTVASFLLSSRV